MTKSLYSSTPRARLRQQWEASHAFALDASDAVRTWAKNNHLGLEVLHVYRAIARKCRPDFLVRLSSGDLLILETKGQDTEQDQVECRYLDEWTQAVDGRQAVRGDTRHPDARG